METEYSSYLGLTEKRAGWLEAWPREKIRAGNVTAKEMAQGLGRLGFAAISLFPGPLYAWSSSIQGRQGSHDNTHHAAGWQTGCDGLKLAGHGASSWLPGTVVFPGGR